MPDPGLCRIPVKRYRLAIICAQSVIARCGIVREVVTVPSKTSAGYRPADSGRASC